MQTTLDAFLHRNQHQSSRYCLSVKNDNICNRLQAGATFSRIESKEKVHGSEDPLWLSNDGSPPEGLSRRRNWHLACLDVIYFQ